MNNENLSFLRDNLRYLGFGDLPGLNEQMEQTIAQNPIEFQLFTESYYGDEYKLEAKLYFRRSDKLDMYFFNKYEVLLRKSGEPDRDRGQTFYINKGSGVTLKEAFNLLQGRSVYKDRLENAEGVRYSAWIQLDFEEKNDNGNYRTKQFRANYGFDLDKVLLKYPILELQNNELKAAVVRSLQRGNIHLVSLVKAVKTEKMYIEACPQYKTINLYPLVTRGITKTGKKPQFADVEESILQAGETDSDESTTGEPPDPVSRKEEETEAVVGKATGRRKMSTPTKNHVG